MKYGIIASAFKCIFANERQTGFLLLLLLLLPLLLLLLLPLLLQITSRQGNTKFVYKNVTINPLTYGKMKLIVHALVG